METGTSLESRPKLATFSINETENRTYEDVGKFVASLDLIHRWSKFAIAW